MKKTINFILNVPSKEIARERTLEMFSKKENMKIELIKPCVYNNHDAYNVWISFDVPDVPK